LRLQAAAYGPVDAWQDFDKLGPEEKQKLVARLRDRDPRVRMRTLRSLPRTTDALLLRALAERLDDPFRYLAICAGGPCPIYLVAHEARDALAWQGKAVIGPLIACARVCPDGASESVIRFLGDLGADPRSLQYLGETLKRGEPSSGMAVVDALNTIGKSGAPLLFEAAENEKYDYRVRRDAIYGLGRHGDGNLHGPFLRALLRKDNEERIGAAAEALGRLGVREAIPDLKRVALDERIDQNARHSAMASVHRLADRKEAEILFLGMLDRKCHLRGEAMRFLAQMDCRTAVPQILDALDDPEWYVRAVADHALRAFSGKSTGVGYDAHNPNASKWRDWWKQRPPK
jgi:HEAT repeat protein